MKSSWWVGPAAAITVLLFFLLLPPVAPLTEVGMKVSGIFLFTIILWIFVGLGYPSLLSIALFVAFGVMTPKEAFAASMGNWLVVFLIACLGLAESLRATGLTRRFALWFMSRPFTVGRPWVLLAMLMLVGTLLAAFMSSMASFVVLMAVAEPMLEVTGYKKGDRFAAVVMMGLAWSATASFIATPVGHASNVLLIEWLQRDLGYNLTFVKWMLVGVPLALLQYLIILGILRFVVRADTSRFGVAATQYILEERRKLGPLKLEEGISLAVFLGVLVSWMLPEVSTYLKGLGYAVPAVIGVALVSTIRVKNRPLLGFSEWMRSVEWSAIMLVGAIMLIGDAVGHPRTGIPQMLTGVFEPIAKNSPFLLFLFISIAWPALQTNIMSNLVTAMMVYSAMMPAAIAAGVGNLAALGFSFFGVTHSAFALPSATMVTAIAVGSGWVPIAFLARYGAITIIPMILLFTFVGYPLAALVFR